MKKLVTALCIVLLMLLCAPMALAAVITPEVDTSKLASDGVINVGLTVVNDSAYDMSSLKLESDQPIAQGQLSSYVIVPGGKIRIATSITSATEAALGQTKVYTLSWVENGQQKSSQIPVTLGTASATMTATLSADKATAKEGDKVTLTYQLSNPGTVEMTGISLSDPIAGSAPVKSGVTLAPGGTTVITYAYTMGKQDAQSAPVITYTVNGEQKTCKPTPETLTIAYYDINLTVDAVKSDPTAEGVKFTVTVSNTGNQALANINITDDLGANISGSAFTLKPGESKTIDSYPPVNPTEARVVVFYANATDPQGQERTYNSPNYEVWPYVDPSKISVSFSASVLEPLSSSGSMKVRFSIQNNSNVEITNAVISETALGSIETMDALPLGQKTVDKDLLVGQPRELGFTLTVADPSGATHDYQAKLNAAYAGAATPTPAKATPSPTPVKAQEGGGLSGTLVTVLIVLAALMAVAGVALLALSIYERRRNATLEEEEPVDLPRARGRARSDAFEDAHRARTAPERIKPSAPRQSAPADEEAPRYIPRSAPRQSMPADEETRRYAPPSTPRTSTPAEEQRRYTPPSAPRTNTPAVEETRGYTPPSAPRQSAPADEPDVKRYTPRPQEPRYAPPEQVRPFAPQPQAEQQPRTMARRPEPEEQKNAQASPEIRNRVHRVNRPDDEK